MSEVLINPFEVPEGQEEEVILYWEKCAAVLKKQKGFISTKLHRAMMPHARFLLINIAEWETQADFFAAIQSEAFQAVAKTSNVPNYPALYEVIRT